jgi:cytochrome c-type biogenesis protein CcmH/NrfF
MRDRDFRWLWHLPASLMSVSGVVWGYITHRRHAHEKKLVSRLQPRQTLK